MNSRDIADELDAIGLRIAAERMRMLEREHAAMREQIDQYGQQVAHLSHGVCEVGELDDAPIRGALFAVLLTVVFALGCALGWVLA